MKIARHIQFDILAGLFLALLVSILFGNTLRTSGELIYSKDVNYFYPNEVVLEAGGFGEDFPVWNPYFGAGAPGLGKIQVGMFYPPLMILRPLFSVETTLDLDAMLHIFLAGLGVYFLMRQLTVGRIPALFTAVAFMLSGSFTPRIFAGHASVLRAIAWSGWLLLAYIRLLKWRTWPNAVLTAIIVGLVITGGHPQMSLIVLLIPAGYFLAQFLPECVQAKQWRVLGTGLLWSIGTVGLALGLTAVQVFPYLAWQGQTVRAAGDAFDSLTAMVNHSFLWQHFLALIMPTIWYNPANVASISLEGKAYFWENSAFIGVLPLLILGVAWPLRSAQQRANRRFFVILALAGLFFSMGTINPLYEFLYRTAPYIRAPGRFMLWWTLATAVSAGIALDMLLKAPSTMAKLSKVAWGLLLCTGLLMVGWQLFKPLLPKLLLDQFQLSQNLIHVAQETFPVNIEQLSTKLGIMAVLFWLMSRWPEYGRYWGGLLVLGVALEMGLFTSAITQAMPLTALYLPGSAYSQLALPADEYRFRDHRRPPLYLVPTVTHVNNGEESNKLQGVLSNENGINLLAANFQFDPDPLNEDWQVVQEQNGIKLYAHRQNLPRIYAAAVVQLVANEAEALQMIGDAKFSGWQKAILISPTNPAELAQLEKLTETQSPADAPAFSGQYLTYGNNQLVAEVTAERPMMVVFSEMYDEDWQVTVNGEAAKLWLANYAFRGVLVEAGTSRITMQYRSQPYRLGSIISLVTLLFMMGSLVNWRFWHGRLKSRVKHNA